MNLTTDRDSALNELRKLIIDNPDAQITISPDMTQLIIAELSIVMADHNLVEQMSERWEKYHRGNQTTYRKAIERFVS